jgi:hypothetical protein
MRSAKLKALLAGIFCAAACMAQTPTPTPPATTQITGLPSTTVADTDEFAIDKLVSMVRRTRKVTASQVLDYIEASNLTFTGIINFTNATTVILPNGAAPSSDLCDVPDEEDGRVFIDTTTGTGRPQFCVCNGASGWICTEMFGDTIDDTELTSEDFGSFACGGTEDGCVLNANSVSSSHVVDNSLTSSDLGADSVTASEIATDAVDSAEIAANAVNSSEIATGAVGTAEIQDGAILEADLNVSNSPTVDFCLVSDGTTGFTWTTCASGAVAAGGSDTQVQYNASNVLSGDAGLTYDDATNTLTAGTLVGTNVTSGADPGHTHTGGAISTDIIEEGDSYVEVVDPGTGGVVVQVDAADVASFDDAGLRILYPNANAGRLAWRDPPFELEIVGPTGIVANRTCTLEAGADASFIPDSCIGDGTDDDDPESINLEAASMATGIADDEVPIGASANNLVYTAIPDSDGATQKLQYDTTTNAFSAGTDDDEPESGDFGNLTGGRSLAQAAGTMDADAELYTDSACANIDPGHATTNWILVRVPLAATVTEVYCLVDAATSVVMTLRECDGDGANCSDIEAAMTCTTTGQVITSIDNASLDAGDVLRITRGTLTGSATQAHMCATWTWND